MKLPIRVVMTSSVPDFTRSQPGHSAQRPPAAMPATIIKGIITQAGAPLSLSATNAAPMAPR